MPLKLVRSDSNSRLWGACVSRFLGELDGHRGPDGFLSHLWLWHRIQRDALLEETASRDLPGWPAPPFSFFSELPVRFGIDRRPIGLLTGRRLVARLAARDEAPGRGHMVDRTLSEILPEGVGPETLREALATLPADEFARRRDAWLIDTYSAYLGHIERRGQFDPRSIHALVAERIEAGGLPAALGGARRLHIYGITSLRGRIRLFRALSREADEWEELAEDTELLASTGPDPRLRVPLGLRSAVNRVVGDRRSARSNCPSGTRDCGDSWRATRSRSRAPRNVAYRCSKPMRRHFQHAFVIHANEGVFPPRTVGGRGTAAGYVSQARAYHDAAASLLADDHDGRPRVRLHFTHPNVVVEIPVGADEKMLSEPLQPS